MASPNVLILRAPGTQCDQETAFAFEKAGGTAHILHINRLLESPSRFRQFQILCVPGGFSYGDDVAAGRILANQIQHHLAGHLAEFKAAEKLILGICNGFQRGLDGFRDLVGGQEHRSGKTGNLVLTLDLHTLLFVLCNC